MIIKNYCPHSINILKNDIVIEYPSLGIARCVSSSKYLKTIDGINIYKMSYGEVIGLPKPEENTVYIVSKIVAEAMKETRNDLLIVNETVKDQNNVILYCKSLSSL